MDYLKTFGNLRQGDRISRVYGLNYEVLEFLCADPKNGDFGYAVDLYTREPKRIEIDELCPWQEGFDKPEILKQLIMLHQLEISKYMKELERWK